MKNTIVRNITEADLIDIAKIHKSQFSDHYLGQFSEKLLKQFYSSFMSQNTIFLVSETNNTISGFVVGGDLKLINQCTSFFIKTHICLYVVEIFLRPHTWIRSLKKMVHILFQKSPEKESLDCIMDYTLLSIAVSPSFQGKGIAKQLIINFNFRMKNYSKEYFLSVKDTNVRALKFYKKNGFVADRHFDGEIQLINRLS